MNKIRVIDLLNKIANKEEMPDEIKYKDKYYFKRNYIDGQIDYANEDALDKIYHLFVEANLNDEIEIIEEPKKIEKISWNEKSTFANCDMSKTGICEMMMARTEQLKKSLNEIIDYINSKEDK